MHNIAAHMRGQKRIKFYSKKHKLVAGFSAKLMKRGGQGCSFNAMCKFGDQDCKCCH